MRASDFRIGNYIKDHSPADTVYIITNISPEVIETNGMTLWHAGFRDEHCIPLTEEWLLKFGFHYRNEHRGAGSILDLDHENWKKSFALAKLTNPNYQGYCALATGRQDIVYVHQLQNLYFALCGEELTIKQ